MDRQKYLVPHRGVLYSDILYMSHHNSNLSVESIMGGDSGVMPYYGQYIQLGQSSHQSFDRLCVPHRYLDTRYSRYRYPLLNHSWRRFHPVLLRVRYSDSRQKIQQSSWGTRMSYAQVSASCPHDKKVREKSKRRFAILYFLDIFPT